MLSNCVILLVLSAADDIKVKDYIGQGRVVSISKGEIELEAPPRTEILVPGEKKIDYPPKTVALKARLEEARKVSIDKLVKGLRKAATFADIKVGQILEVKWDGVIRSSDPPLIKPVSILICDGQFHVEGTIAMVKRDRKGNAGVIRVDGIRNQNTASSVTLHVFPKTTLSKLVDGKREPVIAGDELKVGQRVLVFLSGPIHAADLQDYGDAWDIVVVADKLER